MPVDRKALRYATSGHRAVEGWLQLAAIRALLCLGEAQRKLAVTGPVCEIGVHHGRLFILLHLLTVPPERSVAFDLFDLQQENVDGSGAGSREHLLRNLRAHGCDLERIVIVTENSLRLTPDRILELCGARPRLFSVDGGHTAEITYNDLSLAARTISEGGLVILDDFFNEAWPGVAEGTCRFMDRHGGLFAVGIGGNKLIFAASAAFAVQYRERLGRIPGLLVKHSTAFGEPVVLFERLTTHKRLVRTRVWKAVRDTAVGHVLRRYGRPVY